MLEKNQYTEQNIKQEAKTKTKTHENTKTQDKRSKNKKNTTGYISVFSLVFLLLFRLKSKKI